MAAPMAEQDTVASPGSAMSAVRRPASRTPSIAALDRPRLGFERERRGAASARVSRSRRSDWPRPGRRASAPSRARVRRARPRRRAWPTAATRASRNRAGFAERMSPNRFSENTTSNRLGVERQPHRAGVDVLVLERDVGILLRDGGHGAAPQPRRLEDVGLVHRGDAAARSRDHSNATRATRSTSPRVLHRVVRLRSRDSIPRGSPKYRPPSNSRTIIRSVPAVPLRLKGAASSSPSPPPRRPEVGVAAEGLAERQQAALDPLLPRPAIERGISNRPEQHRLARRHASRVAAGQSRPRRHRRAADREGSDTDRVAGIAPRPGAHPRASAMTSGPMPPPGSKAIFIRRIEGALPAGRRRCSRQRQAAPPVLFPDDGGHLVVGASSADRPARSSAVDPFELGLAEPGPSSRQRSSSPRRPECLPSTSVASGAPTSSAFMIS